MTLLGYEVTDLSALLQAFNYAGIKDVNDMIAFVEDPESATLAVTARALSAEAKLNRIKNLLKD